MNIWVLGFEMAVKKIRDNYSNFSVVKSVYIVSIRDLKFIILFI